MTDNLPPLLPCPFCESSRLITRSNGHDLMFVECEDCGSSGPAEEYEDEAIDGWNRRAALAQAQSLPDGWKSAVGDLIYHIDDVLTASAWSLISTEKWNAVTSLLAASPAQPVHKPLFADLIAKHPGLAEELAAQDAQPVQPSIQIASRLVMTSDMT